MKEFRHRHALTRLSWISYTAPTVYPQTFVITFLEWIRSHNEKVSLLETFNINLISHISLTHIKNTVHCDKFDFHMNNIISPPRRNLNIIKSLEIFAAYLQLTLTHEIYILNTFPLIYAS